MTKLSFVLGVAAVSGTAMAQSCLVATPVGEEFDVSEGVTFQRLTPSVAANTSNGQFMVAWFDLRNQPTTGNDVYAQLVDADGSLIGGNIEVSLEAEAQIDSVVTYGEIENEYLITWRTQQPGFFNNGRGVRLGADGQLLDDDFFVSNAGFESAVVYNPQAMEYFYLARNFAGGGAGGIRAMRIEEGGSPVGSDIGVATAGAPAPNGDVAYDSVNNRYLCAWRDQNNEDLRGQFVEDDGSLMGSVISISDQFPSSGRAATVAFDPANQRYLVTFGQFTGNKIYGRFIGADGTPMGDEFEILAGAGQQLVPIVVYAEAAGAYALAYRDNSTVHLRLLDLDGQLVGDELTFADGFAVDGPQLAENIDGEFLLVWSDNRDIANGIQDIFAQRISITSADPGDFNGDGEKNILDFVAFQNAFVSGDDSADCNGDDELNVLDFVCFQGVFVDGCAG